MKRGGLGRVLGRETWAGMQGWLSRVNDDHFCQLVGLHLLVALTSSGDIHKLHDALMYWSTVRVCIEIFFLYVCLPLCICLSMCVRCTNGCTPMGVLIMYALALACLHVWLSYLFASIRNVLIE